MFCHLWSDGVMMFFSVFTRTADISQVWSTRVCCDEPLLAFHSSLVVRSGGSSDVRLIEEGREEQQVTQIHHRSTHDVVCVGHAVDVIAPAVHESHHAETHNHLHNLQRRDQNGHRPRHAQTTGFSCVITVHEGVNGVIHRHEPAASGHAISVWVPGVEKNCDVMIPVQENQTLLTENNEHSVTCGKTKHIIFLRLVYFISLDDCMIVEWRRILPSSGTLLMVKANAQNLLTGALKNAVSHTDWRNPDDDRTLITYQLVLMAPITLTDNKTTADIEEILYLHVCHTLSDWMFWTCSVYFCDLSQVPAHHLCVSDQTFFSMFIYSKNNIWRTETCSE